MILYASFDGWTLTTNNGVSVDSATTEMDNQYAEQLQAEFADRYQEPCQLVYVDDN